MKTYTGTKTLHATPMTRGDYNEYRSWAPIPSENPLDEGYLVEYVDGGAGNDSRHAGYISWSPKDVFERSYKEIVPTTFQDRVRTERQELIGNLERLEAFADTPTFSKLPHEDRVLLAEQAVAMTSLAAILRKRIARFGSAA